jgi:tripartite-type tricarboxylate transporter receptor subunit TctC
MLNRRHFAAGLTLASLAKLVAKPAAAAADWPQRPVRIVYPYAAGSSGDATARLIAGRLSEALGQAFIVENHTGANGIIATELVARSPADGYMLLWAITPQIAISPVTMKLPYDPVKDFVPISAISSNKFALVVNSKVPVRTVAEFVNYVRAQSNGFAYAEGGMGSIGHLAMVLFLDRAGLKGTNVSYKGTEPALLDVVAGHLPAMFPLFGDALSQAQTGAIRLIAVSSEQRSPKAPDVPTIAESGFPGFEATSWWGLMAPAGTPQPIVDRIAAEVARTTKDPKIVEQFTNFGIDPLGSSPAEFAAMISADIDLWARAVKIAGLEMH